VLVEREPVVEARDTVGIGRRNVQTSARIFEAAATYPANLVLQAMKHRQQQVAP
jgi:hypothetical protein